MSSFQDSIEKMLWPEKRDKDPVLGDKIPGVIDRTTTRSYLRIPGGYLPDYLKPLMSPGARFSAHRSSAKEASKLAPFQPERLSISWRTSTFLANLQTAKKIAQREEKVLKLSAQVEARS